MQIRCPHCRNPIDVVNDDPSGDVSCPSCGSCFNLAKDIATAEDDGTHGKMLGHFQLLHCLGQGAFGAVWKARDTELDRIVAIKIPRKENLTEADAEKFLREARAAAQVRHPNIVSVHEVGREDGHIYIASDFIDGASLEQWVQAHPLTVRESVELCAKIAEALHHAHEAGVVHRDLKPQNILVRRDETRGEGLRARGESAASGQVAAVSNSPLAPNPSPLTPFITDFGLAKRDAGEITMTVEGAILGTPAYMPPEQARGEAHHADRRSDVYSLGVILFRLLTGELPFRGQRQMLIVQILSEEPPALRKLDARLPRDVETICLKCLEKDPTRRYQSAAALSTDLHRWLTGHPIAARPVSRTERAWRWCHRNPAVASLSAAVVLVLLTGMAVSSFFALQSAARNRDLLKQTARANEKTLEATKSATRADAKTDEALVNFKKAQIEKDRADTKTNEARRNLYLSHMNLAQAAWEDARVGHTVRLLNLYQPEEGLGGGPDDLRGFEWYYWGRLCDSDLLTLKLKGHTSQIKSLVFSPDGKRLASANVDQTVKVWDATSGQETLTLRGHTSMVMSVAFSPDGKRLASGCWDGPVKVWDVTSGKETITLRGHTSIVTSVAFSPDGKRLASATWDGTVKVWDTTSGQETLTLKGETTVAFSPDGKRLASASWRTVKVWDATSGQETLTLEGHTSKVESVVFSPDGKRLASACWDKTVKVWDTTNGQETLTLKVRTTLFRHTGVVLSVRFSADGKRLASANDDGTVNVWDATSGQETFTLKGQTSGVSSVAFSADGKRLASANDDGTVKVWDATSGRETLTLKGDTGGIVTSVAFSADGKRLASIDGLHVNVWDLTSGQATLRLVVNGGAFSADGKRLAALGGDGKMRMFDATTGQAMFTWNAHIELLRSMAFSADGKRLAAASLNGTVKVWDAASGQETLVLKGHTIPVNRVAFSADGKRLASASSDETVKVWDAASGQETLTLNGHITAVWSVAFSPDGKRLASASDDGTVKVWDTTSGQETLTLNGHTGRVMSVAFSPDGKRLASASSDGTVKVWDARPWTPELRAEREALSLIHFLRNQGQPQSEWLNAISSDQTLSESVRHRALQFAREWK